MDDKETGRVEAFSDGVFAVAITLLVLNIHGLDHPLSPPLDFKSSGPGQLSLAKILINQWPTYLAFVTSFATIGVMWINHHRLFTHIKRVDTNLFVLNLLLLFVIVFIPFPTELLASYIIHPEDHIAAILYSTMNILLAISFSLLWRYASHEKRLLDQEVVQAITNQYRFGPLFYVVTFVLAFIYVPASVAVTLLLALFFAFPGRRARSSSES